jgi:hypothetical protein
LVDEEDLRAGPRKTTHPPARAKKATEPPERANNDKARPQLEDDDHGEGAKKTKEPAVLTGEGKPASGPSAKSATAAKMERASKPAKK